MKDEIKEINIKIPGQILDYVDTKEHLLDLFNYITNYQQENERLKEENQNLLEEIHKATISSYEQGQQDWKELNKDYKSRCEKASELINVRYKEQKQYDKRLKDLLNILQNGSDNDDK